MNPIRTLGICMFESIMNKYLILGNVNGTCWNPFGYWTGLDSNQSAP